MIYSIIGNTVELANAAVNAGIERLIIDIERIGKPERQFKKDLFLSNHTVEDIATIKKSNHTIKIVFRINKIGSTTTEEVKIAIRDKVDYIMLPYFKTISEVDTLVALVQSKIKLILLIETKEAILLINQLTKRADISEIHFGLNDLAISYGYNNIFEPLKMGQLDEWCNIIARNNKPYGFGGIASLSNTQLPVPPYLILAAQKKLGCSRAWLGRSFRNILSHNYDNINYEMSLLRNRYNDFSMLNNAELEAIHNLLFKYLP
jgi:hypothetical protein